MSERKPKYAPEEFGRRGNEIFERKIAPLVKDEDPYKFVGINIETEDFEIDEDAMAATDRLIARNPEAQIFMRRVGFEYTTWFSGPPMGWRDGPRWRKVS